MWRVVCQQVIDTLILSQAFGLLMICTPHTYIFPSLFTLKEYQNFWMPNISNTGYRKWGILIQVSSPPGAFLQHANILLYIACYVTFPFLPNRRVLPEFHTVFSNSPCISRFLIHFLPLWQYLIFFYYCFLLPFLFISKKTTPRSLVVWLIDWVTLKFASIGSVVTKCVTLAL